MPSTYENRQKAIELQNSAAHTHRVAEQKRGQQEHLTATEQSVAEQSNKESHRVESEIRSQHSVGHGVGAFTHDDIATLAYRLWQQRGEPEGSADEDWFHAVKELRARAIAH
jgi:hypothetical protein